MSLDDLELNVKSIKEDQLPKILRMFNSGGFFDNGCSGAMFQI